MAARIKASIIDGYEGILGEEFGSFAVPKQLEVDKLYVNPDRSKQS